MKCQPLLDLAKPIKVPGKSGLLPYIEIGDIDIMTKKYIKKEKKSIEGCSIAKNGNILISRVRPTRGAVSIVEENEACVSSAFTVLDSLDTTVALNKYVFYMLAYNKQFFNYLGTLEKGTSYPSCREKDILSFKIPIFNIPYQRKMISILETCESTIHKRKEANRLTDEFLKSTFLEMFGDPVKNTNGWQLNKLSEVGSLDRGKSEHRPRNAPELLGGPYPLIQTGDIANSDVYITDYHQTYSELGLKQSKMWNAKTLCITIAANIARTGILTFDACFPDSVVGFISNKKVETEYVHFWFTFWQTILEEKAPKSAQRNINLRILRNLNISVPPIKLQQQFANLVQKVEKLKQKQHESETELNNLFNSLMRKAFRGELF